MGELRFPGLATGIDTAAIIKQLMIINSRRLATYQIQKTDYETQTTALNELRTKISALQSAASALSDADDLDIFSTSTSDSDILTVGASSAASPGSHSIEVNQLATTETWIQDTSTFDYETDYVLTDDSDGVFIYSYNNVERTITAVKNVTTLEDFVNLINNDEDNPGVTASLLHQGGKYHLMLSGQETGEDYQIFVNVSNTEVWEASSALTDDSANVGLTTKITELDTFGGTLGASDDAYITISGTRTDGTTFTTNLDVTANTTVGHIIDEINNRFEVDGARAATATLVNGKIRLTDHTCGASTLVLNTLTYDNGSGSTTLTNITFDESVEGGTIPESLSSLASTSFTQTQDAQNSQIKINDYTPAAVAEVQTLTTNAAAGGDFTLSYGGETTDTIVAGAELSVIKAELEELSGISNITVAGDKLDSGAANMTFTFLGSAGNVGLISINSSLTGTDGNETIVETTKGNNNEWVSRNGNSITDALTGITLNLHDVTEAETPIKITINRNTGSVSKKIQTMVTAYNGLIAELKTKTEYDAEAKKMGILSKDIAVSFIKTQTRDPFIGIADGFVDTIDDFVWASDIGLSIDGAGMMEFDTDEFKDVINDNFDAVLELLGATKSGNSSDTMIQFYAASDKYTTAGTYEVQVDIDTGAITDVRIRLLGESAWHDDVAWPDNFVTCNSDFDDDGNPLYPENGLQFTIDPSGLDGTYDVTINVKQGVAGTLEDLLDEILKTDGRLDTSKGILDDRIIAMDRRIENEENRLTSWETRLINKYARLEKTLAMMQQQMGAVSMVSAATFGS